MQARSEKEFLSIVKGIQIEDSEFQLVFVDLMILTHLLNYDPNCFKFEPAAFQDALISVCYRLLHNYTSPGTRSDNDMEHVCRLGLLALLTTVIYQFNPRRLTYDLLASRFRSALEKAFSIRSGDEMTSLWLLFIGGITVFQNTEMTWLLSRIRTHSLFHVDSWEITRKTFGELPWMNAINDRHGYELWKLVGQ